MDDWPFKYSNGDFNLDAFYKVPEVNIPSYLNRFFKAETIKGLPNHPRYEVFNLVKVIDLHPNSRLYARRFNPISFYIQSEYESFNLLDMTSLEVKPHWQLSSTIDGSLLYRLVINIISLDDGGYRAWFSHKTRKEILSLRTQLFKWLYLNPVVDAHLFRSFCYSLDPFLDWSFD